MGNSQFTKSPFAIPPQNVCDVLEVHYKKNFMENLKGNSNLPQVKPDEKVCPLKRVRFQYHQSNHFIAELLDQNFFGQFSGKILREKYNFFG